MKKIKFLVSFFLALVVLPVMVNAASGTVSVTGTSTVVVNNKVTVTVNLSSSTAIGSWQMQLDYDKKFLQLTSSSAEAGGTVMAASSSSGVKSKKYTFTFKALKTGSTKVSVDMYEAYAFADLSEISLTSSSKSLKIITQEELEASYSKDNDLKDLSVEGYEISPAFSKDNLNYSVTVPEGTTSVNVIATPNDSKSSVSGAGSVEVTEGSNNLSIVVRAENGSEKTYNLVVEVVDANPINVTVDKEHYTVIKLRSNYVCPELYEESEVEIEGFKVPSCYNEKINYNLVGLKKDDGTVESFIYEKGKYTKYNEVTGTSLKIVILDYEKELPGLSKATSMIDGESYATNIYEQKDNYYVVYGLNVATGKKDFYLYDALNNTFALYNNDQVEDLINTNKTYLYVIVAFGIGLLLAIVCIIKLSLKNKKNKKELLKEPITEEVKKEEVKKKKEKPAKEVKVKEEKKETSKIDVNEIKELTEDNSDETETYYLFESDRKKKHKKK